MSPSGKTVRNRLAPLAPPVGIGLVGLGRWGQHYLRVAGSAGARVAVCHTRSRGTEVQKLLDKWPGTVHVRDLEALLDHDVVAVVVASPRDCHAPITAQILGNARHVLVEKPTAVGRAVVDELHRTAKARQVLLRTGYTILHDLAFHEFRVLCARHGADSWFWRWHKGITGYDCVEIVWEFFPHVLATLRALHGNGFDVAVTGRASVMARPGPERTGTVRVTLHDLPAGPTSVEVSTVPGPERRKVIRGFRGQVAVAEWNDRSVRDLLSGRTLRDDREPLARQLSTFLSDAATPEDVRTGERELDVMVAGTLERLARTVAAHTPTT